MTQKLLAGSFQLMKSLNRSLILNTIRTEGPISRAEIAKLTKLTPPTVSNIVKELIDSDIVIESNQGESRGGRKPTMLVINGKNFFVIGIEVSPASIYSVITNLNAKIIDSVSIDIHHPITNESLLSFLSKSVKQLLDKNNWINREHILGIGVAMHGIVDIENGISIYAPGLKLRNIPIKEHLESEFNLTVKVDNDANSMALGEAWFGHGYDIGDFVCVNVGQGIGAGIIINGKLLHGNEFLSGEIGHMTIDIDGPKCSCGNYGCLEALAAGPYLAERAKKQLAMGEKSMLIHMTGHNLDKLTGELIYEAASQGDPFSINVLKETGKYLGIGLSNLIHTINPSCIIMGGGVTKSGHILLDSLKETIKQRGLTEQAKSTQVMLTKLGDQAAVIGAVCLVLVELFFTQSPQTSII
ncbi:glucokinase-like ROK family protein [Scopulibacillus daqui]|uniref:Glucokinase-like ROK family protein n=1 Tax=Scopulibacillus daqui TaxID=1469162 RepID=A0ABS2PZ70_9BACL|nr:ROK family transcriptional regulator [Scopulibacillus daqui]MBM7645171.1 glucokinase-like ROK family protein [Scopulibacillus daqui]